MRTCSAPAEGPALTPSTSTKCRLTAGDESSRGLTPFLAYSGLHAGPQTHTHTHNNKLIFKKRILLLQLELAHGVLSMGRVPSQQKKKVLLPMQFTHIHLTCAPVHTCTCVLPV